MPVEVHALSLDMSDQIVIRNTLNSLGVDLSFDECVSVICILCKLPPSFDHREDLISDMIDRARECGFSFASKFTVDPTEYSLKQFPLTKFSDLVDPQAHHEDIAHAAVMAWDTGFRTEDEAELPLWPSDGG